jgi:hypothetical protein
LCQNDAGRYSVLFHLTNGNGAVTDYILLLVFVLGIDCIAKEAHKGENHEYFVFGMHIIPHSVGKITNFASITNKKG